MNSEETKLLVKKLYKIDFFSRLSVGETDVILAKFIRRVYSRGKTIVRQGGDGRFFAFISSGSVKVLKKKGTFNRCIARLGRGDYFGEISLISNSPATATVKAARKTVLFILSREDFRKILDFNPAMAKKVGAVADKRSLESSL